MLELVTQAEAIAQIRGDTTADGPWVDTWLPIVTNAVALWLKDAWRLYVPELDSSGEVARDSSGATIPAEDSNGLIVQPVVKGAILLELASMFRFREGEGKDNEVAQWHGYGYVLNKASTALLAPLRKSTVS